VQSPCYCIVMEYCPYGQLYEVLRDGKDIPPTLLVSWTKQIATGMSYLHTHKIIHRDLKSPKSVYVSLSVCLSASLSVCLSLCLYLLWSQAGFKTTGFTKNPHLQVFITFRCDLSLFVGKFGFIVGFWTRIARCCHIKWEVD